MKQYLLASPIFLLLSINCIAQYDFIVEKQIQCLPVQDQEQTNTCWSFATSSYLESELMRLGTPAVNLSEMYTVRRIYLDKARNYLLRQGKANFAEGGLSHDVIHSISTYGVIPEQFYPGREDAGISHNHAELITVLKSVLDGMLSRKKVSEAWPAVLNAILDVYLGKVPESFLVNGKSYTPQSYAASLDLDTESYVNITSFIHHPFYKKFVLEIPDNHANGSYYNVPLDELSRIAWYALENGFTVAWDGDVSEKSFESDHGIAVFPENEQREDLFTNPGPEKNVSPEQRQTQFESYVTTDDHLMQLTGTARDRNGTKYLIVKNSWGEVGPFDGYLYMSDAYYRAKTISIMVHKDAIPADILSRISL
jgi:bleomycin hydrolase